MTPEDQKLWFEELERAGCYTRTVIGRHPRYTRINFDNRAYPWLYVKPKDAAVAVYHGQFGYPADPDLVWAAREEYQKREAGHGH